MLLACNIGNTNITLGLFHDQKKVFDAKIASAYEKTADELAVLLKGLLDMYCVKPEDIHGAVISSVVRPLNAPIKHAIYKLTGVQPLLVGPGVKTGLNIKTDIPSQLGADLVANCVAAAKLASFPLVIVSLGTATTLTGMNDKGELCGVMICPGIGSAMEALFSQTAELPKVALDKPGQLLGKNTVDAMVSGQVYGHAAMINGLLKEIAADWHCESCSVVVTGAHAETVLPYLHNRETLIFEPDLTLLGLRQIYLLNQKQKRPDKT